MTIRDDLTKFNDDVKEHVQSFEANHDERRIEADESLIEAETKKEMGHEATIVDNKALDEDGFFKKQQTKIAEDELKHDEKVIERKEENIIDEIDKIHKHEKDFYAEQDQICEIDSKKEKAGK